MDIQPCIYLLGTAGCSGHGAVSTAAELSDDGLLLRVWIQRVLEAVVSIMSVCFPLLKDEWQ